MILFKKAEELQKYLKAHKQDFPSTGFVPTMGALHQGHLSLIDRSKKENQLTVCSIFVNPTQFNDQTDFQKYPVTLEKDILKLHDAGADILFLPTIHEIYPGGVKQLEHYDLGYLENILEGKYRPGHFQGVCQVMHRLIGIVQPENVYMGQKDYQQCLVVKQLIHLKHLPVNIKICATLREADGLAMSSRNLRLNPADREKAVQIFKTLEFLKSTICNGSLSEIKQIANRRLEEHGFRTDYVEVADPQTLELVSTWDGRKPLLGVIAAFYGDVRLIDNMIITLN
jgi:pantoate--beta-alanine ligase